MQSWASLYLAAQAAYLQHLGTARIADVVERKGLFAVRTGVASNTENGILVAGEAPVADGLAKETIAWFDEPRLPASRLCAEGHARRETTRVLVDVGVLDGEQRRGIGRALASTRLREARERGCTAAVLAPSADGAKLYGALAFETYRQPGDRWFYLPMST